MGLIGRVISSINSAINGYHFVDVKVKANERRIFESNHFHPAGDDSKPLKNDYSLSVEIEQTGRACTVGYVDPLNAQAANPGEKRVYSRGANGTITAEVFLKNDGTILIDNDAIMVAIAPDGSFTSTNSNGSFKLSAAGAFRAENSNGSMELNPAGEFVVNGTTIGTDGNIITAAGTNVDQHKHNIISGSSAPGPTSSPV